MIAAEVLFDNEERILVNHLAKGEHFETYTKDQMLKMLAFQMDIISEETDVEIKELVSSTYSKVKSMTNDEWSEMIEVLPLPCLDEELYDDIV